MHVDIVGAPSATQLAHVAAKAGRVNNTRKRNLRSVAQTHPSGAAAAAAGLSACASCTLPPPRSIAATVFCARRYKRQDSRKRRVSAEARAVWARGSRARLDASAQVAEEVVEREPLKGALVFSAHDRHGCRPAHRERVLREDLTHRCAVQGVGTAREARGAARAGHKAVRSARIAA